MQPDSPSPHSPNVANSAHSANSPRPSKSLRVAFQGEPGAFSEAAAIQLLGPEITTVPRATFDAVFRAIPENAADALLVPVENSLAGSVVRVYDLMLENHENQLTITAETILPIELNLIAVPGASLDQIQSVSSHPMALAQCERFFANHPLYKRVPAEDTAGSVREVLARGDKISAAIAGRRAADYYHGVILAEKIQDNSENFTRFVLLRRQSDAAALAPTADARKMSVAMQLAHRPGASCMATDILRASAVGASAAASDWRRSRTKRVKFSELSWIFSARITP